ncbi:MAG: hypothetical protein JWM74_6019 [Myxococcaceae bacterium]|jgi:hypothetical protein|nr:hypothetical protein [Myxococcaceae bacterium]
MFSKIFGTSIVVGYAVLRFGGFDLASHARTDLAPSVRQSPGGYRSWSFWHSGTQGGK